MLLLVLKFYVLGWLLSGTFAYTCIGGVDITNGNGGKNHLNTWGQGGHTGKSAPCAISKTYTAYEDHILGDGNRGSSSTNNANEYPLFGGPNGLQCVVSGVCTGKDQTLCCMWQDAPVVLLGTDSNGCCCSAGSVGLGLKINEYTYDNPVSVLRYMECDSELRRNNVQAAPCVSTEVCQFEIVSMPSCAQKDAMRTVNFRAHGRRGTLYGVTSSGGRGNVLGNCSKTSPCIVPPYFNGFQPVSYNLVGPAGRFETSRLFFRPYPGDVGFCSNTDPACSGLLANRYHVQSNQRLWLYAGFQFMVRSFTWKYSTDDNGALKEFSTARLNRYVERIEDAYKKYLLMNIKDLFIVEGCPCSYVVTNNPNSLGFYCSSRKIPSLCSGADDIIPNAGGSGIVGGTIGRVLIIDFAHMRAVDGGLSIACDVDPLNPRCYSASLMAQMMEEVRAGCGLDAYASNPAFCFSNLSCPNGCTGASYRIFRLQTGVSDLANQSIRIVPYNDRPSVGGAGNSLRFDGVDDLFSSTIDVFPRDAFSIMFWVKGLDRDRPGQGLLSLISPENGLELQLFNSQNLELFIHGSLSGPTGIDINSDLLWHHVTLTWTSNTIYAMDHSIQPAGSVKIYVDCTMVLDGTSPRASQSTAFGGRANYTCANGGVSWSGILSPHQLFSPNVEISFGQRQACNSTTKDKLEEIRRTLALDVNQSFCRRSVRPECDPQYAQTASIYNSGIYSPQQEDCVNTTAGIFLSGQNCTYNESDPYSIIFIKSVRQQVALNRMKSNEVDPSTGSQASPYTIPVLKVAQIHLKEQCNCMGGCFDNNFAFNGHLDDFRVYNYTLLQREIAFVNRESVRDGVNCDASTVFINVDLEEKRCSHMIDDIFKYGLVVYYPFDDPVSLYGIMSSMASGLSEEHPDLQTSYDVANVVHAGIGNLESGIKYAARLGGGMPSASPMFVPSTAPIKGARNDFEYYARNSYHQVLLRVRDVDTCVNGADPLDPTSDSYEPESCDTIECSDSLCDLLRVQMLSTGYGFGIVYHAQVKSTCTHPYSANQCSPSPECAGLQCFEHASTVQKRNQPVNRLLMFTGTWVGLGTSQYLISRGLQGVTFCDGSTCSSTTFSISKTASNIPTGRTGSLTYWSVKLQQGPITEYRNIICQGGGRCDPRGSGQSPDPGWVLTLDKPLSFVPINGRTKYWIYKGNYESVWPLYYFSSALGGGGIGTDLLTYNVYDSPGEAGTQLNQNIGSQQSLVTGPADVYPIDWNEPISSGRIIMTPINAPLAFPYNVTVLKGLTPSIINIDVVLDADSGDRGFNLTVNGPQQIDLADRLQGSSGGNNSGDMYQVLEIDCDLVDQAANCSTIPAAMYISQGGSGRNITWCDDFTYVKSTSLMQTLLSQDKFFRYGLISKICTKNSNRTEIYNVTAYNFSCLPPCVGTMYSYQEIAVGCLLNCTLKALGIDKKCENTYGLYADEFVCNGGVYHGQPCMSPDDQGSCFDLANPTQVGICTSRDDMPGIIGPNLKTLPGFNRSDPGLMVHGVYHGDLHFVDWLHRGAKVTWNEVAVDVAAGLGFFDILKYLIQNGCPWRDSAIDAAILRGRTMISAFLLAIKPPNGIADPICGCSRFFLHPIDNAVPRCFPHSALECYPTCSSDADTDVSCQNGHSNYIDRNTSVTHCTTGSRSALVRGPQIFFLSNILRYDLRQWSGTSVGFSKRVIICTQRTPGVPPINICGNVTLVKYGSTIDFWNYHLSDPRLRVFYFPSSNSTPGRIAKFNFTVSRMTQSPVEDLTGINGKSGLLFSAPIAARIGVVEIQMDAVNYRPRPDPKTAMYYLAEDQISILTLRFKDPDTEYKNIRAYITDFPKHGDLHQVFRVDKILNKSYSSNFSFGYGKLLGCMRETTDCRATGNCDHPIKACYYVGEHFVVGNTISKNESEIRQMPSVLYNTSSTAIFNIDPTNSNQPCIQTDRYDDDGGWAGEDFCDFSSQDNVYGRCRRCMTPIGSPAPMPGGHWSGRIILPPTFIQRHESTWNVDAPNDPEQGGMCTLDELCSIGGNTASKSSCIDWNSLDANGRPAINKEKAWLLLNPSYSEYGPPCKGRYDSSNCSRNISFLWPPGYEPYSPNQRQYLSSYGDPVDRNSFYRECGSSGVHQFRAQYEKQVFMTGFDLYSTMPGNVHFRILARSGRRRLQNTFSLSEVTDMTRISSRQENFTLIETRVFRTNTKQCNTTTIYCGGEEWREVWRGAVSEGRNASSWSRSVLLGPDEKDGLMTFRFPATNFTTSELILEACGLMYGGSTNNDGGNPLESLEGLVLVGTLDYPKGLVSNEDLRIAYIPHPHFTGNDSFSYRGEDFQNKCHGYECDIRANLQEGQAILKVENINDQPYAEEITIIGNPDESILFSVNGIDASPDYNLDWTEWGWLSSGTGLMSQSILGKHQLASGSFDDEADSHLTAVIVVPPDRGSVTQLGQQTFKYSPPKGAGGRPLTSIQYIVTDLEGLSSSPSSIIINVLCNPGYFIHQPLRLCAPCPKGSYKSDRNDATSCKVCSSGKYSGRTASTLCLNCTLGTFAAMPGSVSCKSCRPGTFANSTGMKMCTSCLFGTYAPRPFATMCVDCGPLSYNPLPGHPQCYDCPYLSRSTKLASKSVRNCMCVHNSYSKSILDMNVLQRWSEDGQGAANGSFVAPEVQAIKKPWPVRLDQISSNCTECPEGGFCYGDNVYPVTKIAYWTDWSNDGNGFWPNKISPRFYKCKSRNIRAVCLGYPLFDQQEQMQVCMYRQNYRACANWPSSASNSSNFSDSGRCKVGYQGVICSECTTTLVQECVPKSGDTMDGWFSWQSFENWRANKASSGIEVPDCYTIGRCFSGTNASKCQELESACNMHSTSCRWDKKVFYRNYAGFCLPCPLAVGEGFIIYVVWFTIYGFAVSMLIFFYLTDMKSFAITISFFQLAALTGRFQLAWPSTALSLLHVYSIANINLEALPWKCFFDVTPTYRDLWYLTMFVPAGLVGGIIVWWVFPFIVVPHRGKVALKAFKQSMNRLDYLKGTASFPRSQYTTPRSNSIKRSSTGTDSASIHSKEQNKYDPRGELNLPRMPVDELGDDIPRKTSPNAITAWDGSSVPLILDRELSSEDAVPTIENDISIEDASVEAGPTSNSRTQSDMVSAGNFGGYSLNDLSVHASVGLKTQCFHSDDSLLLPGSVLSMDTTLQELRVSGQLFGNLANSNEKGKGYESDIKENSRQILVFNRGRAAISSIESGAAHINSQEETMSQIISEVPEGDLGDQPEIAKKMTGSLITQNSIAKGFTSDIQENTQKCRADARLSTPSKEIRKSEGYLEWSTQNITQSSVPRMEQRLDTARSTASSDEVYKPLGLPWYARKQYIDLAWRNSVAILDMMFVMAGCKTLEVFQWSAWTQDTIVLDVDPNVAAFGSVHTEILPIAFLAFPFFVAFPLICNIAIFYGWKQRMMDNQTFAMRWGFLLDPFERKYWFWNIVISLRKLAFILAVVFLQNNTFLQLFLPVLVVVLNIIANSYHRPYRIERHNQLETVLLIGLLFMMIAGMMTANDIVLYHDTTGQELSGPYDIGLILCIFTTQFCTLVISMIFMYYDILEAQISLPKPIMWIFYLVSLPWQISFQILKYLTNLGRNLFSLRRNQVVEQPNMESKTHSKQSQFQSATAFNREVQGDPPVVTGGRLADILWDVVSKLRMRKEPSVLQSFDNEGDLIRPDDNSTWLRDKFAIQKRVFILERTVQIEHTFDKRSANILRIERLLSVALDAAIAYHKQERDHFYDLLYDAETEHQLLLEDYTEASRKLAIQQRMLSEIVDETNFAQVKLDTEIRRVGMPEEWKRLFIEEQAKRHALEQEIADLQSQVDKIKLDPGGVWGDSANFGDSQQDRN